MRGWKFDRDRLKQNLQYLARYRFDYYRILTQVGWSGNEISEKWPDHVQILKELIDYGYDELGLRAKVTGIGGGDYDAKLVTEHMIAAIQGREHKVILNEVVNEWYGNWDGSEEEMKAHGKRLKSMLPNLVALSAPQEELATARIKPWVTGGYSNAGTVHLDRDDDKTEKHWRHVRKPWECRNPDYPTFHGEPGGPRSSVASYMEAIHLVNSRAVGILCGIEGYCLHNGAGVTGQVNAQHQRPANLWEVPGIDEIMRTVRALDKILPPNPSSGEATRKGLGPHPLTADIIWVDGGDHGVVRDYARVQGRTFWQCLQGIKNYVNVMPNKSYQLTLTDTLTHEVREMTVQSGKSVRIENSPSHDLRGYGAWIVKGTQL